MTLPQLKAVHVSWDEITGDLEAQVTYDAPLKNLGTPGSKKRTDRAHRMTIAGLQAALAALENLERAKVQWGGYGEKEVEVVDRILVASSKRSSMSGKGERGRRD